MRFAPVSPVRCPRSVAVLAAAGLVGSSLLAAAPTADAAAVPVSPTGTLVVHSRGNGHGHGMSQYGAQGAALAGLTYPAILRHYYRGARLRKLPSGRAIRVHLSGYGKVARVGASGRLSLTHVGRLRSAGVNSYRLIAGHGSTLTLQRLVAHPGARWTTVRTGLPDGSAFRRPHGWSIRLYRPNRSSTWYQGTLRVHRHDRTAQGLYVVNRLSLDRYTAGVVSSEIPTSWARAAVRAQAIAARTYALYEMQHHSGGTSDICDTTSCQVYGGRAELDRAGHVIDRNYWPAAAATARKVLLYRGRAIFAQFSASNGGWMSSGGQPYLAPGVDRYDAAASGDPYLDRVDRVRVSSIAHYFGLARVSTVAITRRDHVGVWGGRVVSGWVQGTDLAGKTKRVAATGDALQASFGWLGTTLFRISAG